MSSSIYRGKLYTNDEIKGPFTEAADHFVPEAFATLLSAAYSSLLDREYRGEPNVTLSIHHCGKRATIMIALENDVWIAIDSNGVVEIGEGAA